MILEHVPAKTKPAVPSSPPAPTTAELKEAMAAFAKLFDAEMIDAWQPTRYNAVYTSPVVVWMMLYQRLHPNASLVAAVAEFSQSADRYSTNKRVREKRLSPNSSGFSKARLRLDLEVAKRLSDHIFETLLPTSAKPRTFIMDGSTLSLASVPTLRKKWPPNTNQHGMTPWPILRIVYATELTTGMAIRPEHGCMYGSDSIGEQALGVALLSRIPKGSRLIADRNFGIFYFVWAANQAGLTTMTRLTKARAKAALSKATPIDQTRWKLTWTPSKHERPKYPDLPKDAVVAGTLHEFRIDNDETLWVVSTGKETTNEVKAEYKRRIDIETNLRHLKQTLAADEFRGKSSDMVLKELFMAVVAYNLVVQVRALAAAVPNIHPQKISFSGVWNNVTRRLLNQPWPTAEAWEAQFEWVIRGCLQLKLPNRKKPRTYPRALLARSKKYPSRHIPPE
jgi:hypothetical protein